MAQAPDRPRIVNSAQYARAGAALIVVLFHASVDGSVAFGGDLDHLFRFGVAGVDVFFVLSGFIMYLSVSHEAPRPADFMARRIARIVPLYWIATLCLAVLYLDRLIVAVPKAPFYYISSFLFIPQAVPGHPGEFYPLLSVGWTLNFEMFFYALLGLCLWLAGAAFIKPLLGLLAGLVLLGVFLKPEGAVLFTYTSPLILEFAGGLLLGIFYQRGVRISLGAACVLAGLAVVVVLMSTSAALLSHWARVVGWGLPALGLMAAAVLVRVGRWDNRFILLLGNASYAIYLFHPIVITLLRMTSVALLGKQESPAGAVIFILIALVLGTGAGVAIHLWIERPITQVLRCARPVEAR